MSIINSQNTIHDVRRKFREAGYTEMKVKINNYALELIRAQLAKSNQLHPSVEMTINDLVCRGVMRY